MDRNRLLPIALPAARSANGHNGSSKGKSSFAKRMAVGFIILACLGLLYVPAYHSAQDQFTGLGETPSPVGSLGGTRFMSSVAQLRGWSFNTSRDVGTYIHPENSTIILNPKSICSDAPYLLIVICSAVSNINARIAIRNTWANKTHLETQYNSSVKVVFLLGISNNDTLNGNVVEESHLYNDVIQESFHDTYNNLTLKSAMMLKWTLNNCNNTTYLMKTDDDMFVNVPSLVKALKRRIKSNGTLIGSLFCNARPITDPRNKWYSPKYMYSERTYPNYLSGTGYVMSIDVADRLYKAALITPLLHLEDVYITGVCAKRAGVRPVNHYGFSYVPRKLDVCSLRESITAHKINATSMYTAWNKINEPSLVTCPHRSASDKKAATASRLGRRIGMFIVKSRILSNRCT